MKRLLIVAAALVVLLIAALALFLATLDVNQYKPSIVAAVEEATGRSFDIKGDIGLRPSLIPTLSVAGVSFGNADWAAHDTMATVERFEAQIKLLPLLGGRIDVKRIVLIGARVVLETDRKGKGNWVLAAADADEPPDEGELPSFDLEAIIVKDALIEFRAHEADAISAAIGSLEIGTAGFGQPLEVRLDAQVNDIAFSITGTLAPLPRLLGNEPYEFDLNISSGDVELTVKGSIEEPLHANGLALEFGLSMPSTTALANLVHAELPAIGPVQIKAEITGEDKRYEVTDLSALLGTSDLGGRASLDLNDDRPAIELHLESKLIDLAALEAGAEEASTSRDRIFSTDPLELDLLRQFDAEAEITIGHLQTARAALETLRSEITLKRGKLEIKKFNGTLEGGTLAARITLDASRDRPRFMKTATIKNMALASFLNGPDGDFARGGTVDVDVQIAGEGKSLAEIMGSADVHIRIDATGLEISNQAAGIAGADLFMKAFDILNPLSKSDNGTVIECAVVNFPVKGGIMSSETGIGISTAKLNILGGGSVDFKTEKIDIGVNPKPREGIGLNLTSLSEFVRLGGTLAHPKPTTDAKGAATAGLKVGAAIATGGLSLLAEGVFDRVSADTDVCAIARGDAELPAGSIASKPGSKLEKAGQATTEAVKGAAGKLKDAFKGLFGK
ncbi:MAG: AsmA family protein [Gammaproteobacteria bacterium]|nr:AsmA family protein [Gammaproteobacteria bacterium]